MKKMEQMREDTRKSFKKIMDEFHANMDADRAAFEARIAAIKAEGIRSLQQAVEDGPDKDLVQEAREIAHRLAPMPVEVIIHKAKPESRGALHRFLGRITPAFLAALIAGGVAGNANDAINFVNTNWASHRPEKVPTSRFSRSKEKERIRVAAIEAARRHGIPESTKLRLTQQESGFRFVRGPMTPYGRAYGPFQMLCSTAKSLGEGDCSRLMRDENRAAELAALYLKQGFEATGNWNGAAKYYHGGSNQRMWGPKTRAYAAAVAPVRVADRDSPFDTRRSFGAAPIQAGFQVAFVEYR